MIIWAFCSDRNRNLADVRVLTAKSFESTGRGPPTKRKSVNPREVSPNGGAQPRWRGDGRELFFIDQEGEMMSVTVERGSTSKDRRPTKAVQHRTDSRPHGQSVCSQSRWTQVFGAAATQGLSGILFCDSQLARNAEVTKVTTGTAPQRDKFGRSTVRILGADHYGSCCFSTQFALRQTCRAGRFGHRSCQEDEQSPGKNNEELRAENILPVRATEAWQFG